MQRVRLHVCLGCHPPSWLPQARLESSMPRHLCNWLADWLTHNVKCGWLSVCLSACAQTDRQTDRGMYILSKQINSIKAKLMCPGPFLGHIHHSLIGRHKATQSLSPPLQAHQLTRRHPPARPPAVTTSAEAATTTVMEIQK